MTRKKHYFVNVWITMRCNFMCRYCYVKPYYKNADMDKETADKMIDFIVNTIGSEQELIMNFHGGEPTICYEMIKYIIGTLERRLNNVLHFGITTNGSLLTDEMAEYLAKKCDYNLSISIDGNEKTHMMNRIPKSEKYSYEDILRRANKLLELNENTRIRMTFDRYNLDELHNNIIFFVKNGFKYIVPSPDIFATDWTEEDFEKASVELKKVKKYIKNKNLYINLVSEKFPCLERCDAANDYYSIDPDGNVFPCTFLVGKTEWIIGNCTEGLRMDKLEEIRNLLNRDMVECAECVVGDKCLGKRCLFTNYATTGDYYKPNLVECNFMNLKLAINNLI